MARKLSNFTDICQLLEIKIQPKVGILLPKTLPNKLPERVQKNFEKVQKTTFLNPKMVKNCPFKKLKQVKCLTENLEFRANLPTVRAENTPKSMPFKAETNSYFF